MSTTQPNLNLESLYRPLWLTYGLVPLLAGLDKFLNLRTDWPKYLSPMVEGMLPVSPQTFMYAVGIIEIAAARVAGKGRGTGFPQLVVSGDRIHLVWTDVLDGRPRLRGAMVDAGG